MILLLDIGNSRIKCACLKRGCFTRGECTYSQDEALERLIQRFQGRNKPRRVVASNVLGPLFADAFCSGMERAWGVKPEFVVPLACGYGVVNAYAQPERLGADRWAALIAVRNIAVRSTAVRSTAGRSPISGAACVINCGTAVTIDALSESGGHLGGLIVPGLTTMRRALVDNTAGIQDAIEGEVVPLARTTKDAVTSGTFYSVVALIDRITTDIASQLGSDMARIITGGDAERLLPYLAGSYQHIPDLVLRGLAVIAESAA
jgi:pantothenate kinase, type III